MIGLKGKWISVPGESLIAPIAFFTKFRLLMSNDSKIAAARQFWTKQLKTCKQGMKETNGSALAKKQLFSS